MQQTHSGRVLRAATAVAVALPALLVSQHAAHAWAGYGDAPTTYTGKVIPDPAPTSNVRTITPTGNRATDTAAINNAINQVSAGGTIVFNVDTTSATNTWRVGDITVDKEVTLRGAPNKEVWFDGSVLVPASEWRSEGSGRWSTDTTPTGSQANAGSVFQWKPKADPKNTAGVDKGTNPLADDGEMAFFGNTPQVQVATVGQVTSGKFCVTRDATNGRLYVYTGGSAPTNVYLSRFNRAFLINTPNVTVQGLNFRRFVGSGEDPTPANPDGGPVGVAVEFTQNFGTVDRCVFFWNAHGGLDMNGRMIVKRSDFVSNGEKGIGGASYGSQIMGNYIAFNNAEGFNNSWATGGIKLGDAADVDIYDNHIENNRGYGIWIDVFSINVRIFRNYIHDQVNNEGSPANALFFEISKNCTAAFNVCRDNGSGLYSASPGTRFFNNTLYRNKTNIYVKDETGRSDRDAGGDNKTTPQVENELRVSADVRNNIIMAETSFGLDAYYASADTNDNGRPTQPSKNAASRDRFTNLNYNVYDSGAAGTMFKWLPQTATSYTLPAFTPYDSLQAFYNAGDGITANFEDPQGEERTPSSVFVNAGVRNFRVKGSDAAVARGGVALPTSVDSGSSANIRGLLRDSIPFVGDALNRSDLDTDAVNALGQPPASDSAQYRGAFKPDNSVPRSTLTSPANNTRVIGTPASMALAATAQDDDGTIAKVEFYSGSTKIGEDTSADPTTGLYTMTWGNVARGTYSLASRAIDNDGASGDSATVTCQVYDQVKAINAGGLAVAPFGIDAGFSGGSVYAAPTPPPVDVTTANNPAPVEVYQSERYGSTGFTYTLTGLTAGATYQVRLHFAETIRTAAGQRLFGVNINGNNVLGGTGNTFDIYAQAGGANRALIKEFNVTPSGSQIVIEFIKGGADSPKINGIEVVR